MNNLARHIPPPSNNPTTALRFKPLRLSILLVICLANIGLGQQAPNAGVQEERAQGKAKGAITGRVVGEDGRPLSDVVIHIYRSYARVPGPPQSASTDTDGRFRFTELDSGLYNVRATLAGFNEPDAPTDFNDAVLYRLGDSANLTLVKGGVITGTVRDANGEALVSAAVRAVRVRDAEGRALATRYSGFFPERMTDDRGVYRIYGLPPGTYVVFTGPSQRLAGVGNAYDGDAPTFFPSSTRDTAAEVPLRGGEEATGIDIRYRGERGHTISGKVSGFVETKTPSGVSVLLKQTTNAGFETATFVMPGAQSNAFSFSGLSDGEYELVAQQWGGATNDSLASIPRRVTVKGADITGIDIALAPLASISGRFQLEAAPPKEGCVDGRGATLLETVIHARRVEKNQTAESSGTPFFNAGGSVPADDGEFAIRNLMPGGYRLGVRLPVEAWYVRAISLPVASQPPATAKSPQAKSNAASPSLINLKAGERLTNVTVQVAQDAAGLRGRMVAASAAAEGAAAESVQLPLNLKVHLVPVERERAEDVLRYGETQVGSDGAFAFRNLAPGRYYLIARPATENEGQGARRAARPLAWDAEARAKLRREAEAANATLELKSCQRMSDYRLRMSTP
jgi:hypothetical protein